jgi:hypothetical protein
VARMGEDINAHSILVDILAERYILLDLNLDGECFKRNHLERCTLESFGSEWVL